jgi:hypothetical protein
VHTRAAVIGVFRLASREQALRFWNALVVFQVGEEFALLKVDELAVGPRGDGHDGVLEWVEV